MQVAEAKHVGIEDDDGVRVGHVEAVFDDGGADEYVEARFHEAQNQFLHFVAVHLAVARGDAGVWNESLQQAGHFAEVLDAVVDDVNLAAAAEFVGDGVAQALFVEADEVGVDRLAVGGRSGHDAQVPRRHQRELQGARYGRGRQRQGVDVGLEGFEFVFGVDSEFLFFVDDHQAKVLEFQVLAEDPVGSDEDVDFAVLQVVEHGFGLFG